MWHKIMENREANYKSALNYPFMHRLILHTSNKFKQRYHYDFKKAYVTVHDFNTTLRLCSYPYYLDCVIKSDIIYSFGIL